MGLPGPNAGLLRGERRPTAGLAERTMGPDVVLCVRAFGPRPLGCAWHKHPRREAACEGYCCST